MTPPLRPAWHDLKLLILDVDGVMTDGRVIIDDDGRELKFFHVRDGHGIKLFQRTGLRVALVTGRESRVVAHRARELDIDVVYQGVKRKIEAYEKILGDLGLTDAQVAVAGDDLVDLPIMRRAALSLAPADAADEVRAEAGYVCRLPGGRGAVREMVEFILKSLNLWDQVTERYY